MALQPYRTESYEIEERKRQARYRRQVLARAGASTYVQRGHTSILCLCCGIASHNPNDVLNRYCGFCHEFHSEEQPDDERADEREGDAFEQG